MILRSHRSVLAVIALAVAGATVIAPATRGQAETGAEEPVDEVFFDSVDLTVVNIDVYVTDKKGQSVADLEKDDFEIYEDGKPVAVTNFYAVARGRPRGGERVDPIEAERLGPATDLPQIAIPEDQRLSLIVYVDNLFVRPPNRNKVLREARAFLRRVLRGGDRAMVVSFDRSLHLRQPFTRDHSLIESALLELEELTGYGVQAATERSDIIRRLERVQSAFEAEGHVEGYANSRYFEVRQTINALKAQVASLAGLPGRKAILYVSDGFPMTAAEDLFLLLDQRYPDQTGGELAASRFRSRRLLRELTYDANANRVTFYTLQAKGLRSHQSLSAASRSPGGSLIEIDAVYDSNFEAPLEMMARDTGGLAALGTNNIDGALEKVATDFDTYYSLGYAPQHVEKGRYYRIEVKVKRKGLQVRHREGYRDKPPEERFTDATLAALHFGNDSNDIGIRLTTGTIREGESGRFIVPLEVKIPIGALALLPRAAQHQGKLQVAVVVRNEDGDVSPVSIEPLALEIPDRDIENARKQHYTFAVELLMKKGIHRITVGVLDDLAGETSFTGGAVQVGT